MIEMCVRQDDEVEFGGIEGQWLVVQRFE